MQCFCNWTLYYWKKLKTLWQKEKLLILSNFFFCQNVFKSRLLQIRQKASTSGKGLTLFSKYRVTLSDASAADDFRKHCGKSRNCSWWNYFWPYCMNDSHYVNPFPHKDAFWLLCSRWLFENIVTKKEIAQTEQFLLLPQCFPLLVIGYPFN